MTGEVVFLLGGARSGKSRLGEQLVEATPGRWIYLATAEALDDEMADRIAAHRSRRDSRWRTVEEPLDLPAALVEWSAPDTAILVDCLTLWLSNLMGAGRDPAQAVDALVQALSTVEGRVVLISNEVGQGIVPDNALARTFRDTAGRMHQAVAEAAHRVLFVVAGLPLTLKDVGR